MKQDIALLIMIVNHEPSPRNVVLLVDRNREQSGD